MESGKFTSIHQLIDASLDSVLGEGVADLRLRRKICRGMLDELRKSHSQGDASAGPLPRSPHMLCSEKMEGLLHGEVMSDQYVDLFWFLFAQTCGFRHTGIDRNCQDLRFPQENGTDCPFVLGERKDLLRKLPV